MTKRYLTIPAVVAGALGLGAAARASDAQPTTAELMKQIDELQAKVQQMEAKQSALTTQTVNDTVERVLRDADKRSQLLQMEGFTAGMKDGRFYLGSVDGDNTFMPYLLFQVRSTSNHNDTDGDTNSQSGYSLPRIELGFDGRVFKKFEYFVRWNSGDSDGGGNGPLNLEQAWIRHELNDQFALRSGQMVDPVFGEQLVANGKLLAADRSMMNQIITGADQSYTQGAVLEWTPDSKLKVEIGYTDGINTGNTNFQDFPDAATNFGFAGRATYCVFGNPADALDFSAMGNKEDMLMLGAGFDWTEAGDTNAVEYTFDVQWENAAGLAIYGAFVGQWIQNGSGTGITGVTLGNDDHSNWGALVQVSYMLNAEWEIFGRYDYTNLDDAIAVGNSGSTQDAFNEVTAGVNWYFHGHNAKFTADLSWLPDGAPAGLTNLGILSSDDYEVVFRTQFQLML